MSPNKKHKLVKFVPIVTDVEVKPSKPSFFNKQPSPEIILEGWKLPILDSIQRFKTDFEVKKKEQNKIVDKLNININLLNKYQANTFEIVLYKSATKSIVANLKSALGLKSFYLIKKEFANFSLFVSLDYSDSISFIQTMQNICRSETINKSNKKLKLIRSFRLSHYEDLMSLSNCKSNVKQTFKICLDLALLISKRLYNNKTDFYKDFDEFVNKFELKFEGVILPLQEGLVIVEVMGNLSNIRDLLLFFELEYAVFSEFIRTDSYDASGAADIMRVLKKIPIKTQNDLPIVCLFDANLPERSVLNNILKSEIIAGYKIPHNPTHYTPHDHAVQMASIISFGSQLFNVDDVDILCSQGLTSYAKIMPIMMGVGKPQVKLDTLPKMLLNLKEVSELKNQKIKICNSAFNIEAAKKDCEGLSLFSYLIDKFLFFHQKFSLISSVGNVKQKNIFDNHHTYQDSNLCIPSDGLNILSVGAISGADRQSTVSSFSRKDSFNYGIISNKIPKKIEKSQSIKRLNCSKKKPDILAIGENWSPAGQTCRLQVFSGSEKKSGTSHATAYVSHLAAQSIREYPEMDSALSMEAILLNSTQKSICNLKIDPKKAYSSLLKNKVKELNSKTSKKLNVDWMEKENTFLQKRFCGLSGSIDINNLLFNKNNVRTFICEGEIALETLTRQQIDLSEFINEDILKSSTVTFSGTLVYRGIPFLRDSICSNLINIIAKIGYFNDYITEKNFYEGLPIEEKNKFTAKYNQNWSSKLGCTCTWGNRQILPSVTNKYKFSDKVSLGDKLLANNFKLEILVQAMAWRNKKDDIVSFIKDGLKEFFKNKEDCPEIWRSLWNRNKFNLNEFKIPYSIALSVKTNQDVNLYAEAEAELEVELGSQQSLF